MSNQPDRVKMFVDYEEECIEAGGVCPLCFKPVYGHEYRSDCNAQYQPRKSALEVALDSHALLLAEQAKEIKELKERVEKLEEFLANGPKRREEKLVSCDICGEYRSKCTCEDEHMNI